MAGLAPPVNPSEVDFNPKAEKAAMGKITNVLGHAGDLNVLPDHPHPFSQLNPAEVSKVSDAAPNTPAPPSPIHWYFP